MSEEKMIMDGNSTVGLVGLGQMGLPIAERLGTAFDVVAFDIAADRRELAGGIDRLQATDRLADLAGCGRIVLSLPNPAISHAVLAELGPQLAPGTIVIETSTVLPDDVREMAAALAAHDVRLVEAAVLSGVGQMSGGTATLLIGGEEADLAQVRDLLAALGGGGIRELGALGSAMAAKVVNNGVAHAVMVVLVEAFAMARAQGVRLTDIAAMLSQPDAGLLRPLTHRMMERVAGGNYTGGMSLDAARKDSTLALAMAQRSGVPLFATQAAQSVYDLAAAAGLGRDDYAAIATLWQSWTGQSLTFGEQP
ncbi:NAD(P)-dependent oxidoreductase [Naumannella huperziae]